MMNNRQHKPSVMFIAGEPSGDLHASAVIRVLKNLSPHAEIDIWGIGGPLMASAGLRQVMPFEPFNRMGYAEVIGSLPFFLNAKKELVRMMKSPLTRPNVLVCVDYSGFNIPMMKEARKLNIPVVWYIAPMVWAWKRKRAEVLGNLASHIAVIFPFETQYFSKYPAPVTFVGNPLTESLPPIDVDAVLPSTSSGNGGGGKAAELVEATVSATSKDFRLAIIPGSRPQEIKNMLGVMTGAADMLRKRHPQVKVTVSRFKGLSEVLFNPATQKGFDLFTGPLPELLQNTDLALITSGTATLEAALLGVPMVIAYRTSPLSYAIYRHFVKISRIGLPNIVAGEAIIPECVQKGVTAKKLYAKMDKFVAMPPHRLETIQNLSALRAKKNKKKPSTEVANIVYSYM
jgi:lipid-A-disaccharide synthase